MVNRRSRGDCTRSSTMPAWAALDWSIGWTLSFTNCALMVRVCFFRVFGFSPHNEPLIDLVLIFASFMSRFFADGSNIYTEYTYITQTLTNPHSQVNYLGLVRCCKAFLPIFRRQMDRNCRIINLTSIAGLIHGHQTWSAYMASKHAANAFSHVLRAETRPYVQVATVNPSFHATAIVHNLQAVAASVWGKLDDATRQQYGPGR
jgi:hypothetical protein